ncbi:type III restriction enzyme [Nitzschia inconspicua]|uniref:Type III restriction enzyme n=1 Tax=Nitzschia inconspicua TaxID=303405 RepID=A0A9K3LER5_9STRA|nr:type III restriction enzyme [Nitzschia inconspicua]
MPLDAIKNSLISSTGSTKGKSYSRVAADRSVVEWNNAYTLLALSSQHTNAGNSQDVDHQTSHHLTMERSLPIVRGVSGEECKATSSSSTLSRASTSVVSDPILCKTKASTAEESTQTIVERNSSFEYLTLTKSDTDSDATSPNAASVFLSASLGENNVNGADFKSAEDLKRKGTVAKVRPISPGTSSPNLISQGEPVEENESNIGVGRKKVVVTPDTAGVSAQKVIPSTSRSGKRKRGKLPLHRNKTEIKNDPQPQNGAEGTNPDIVKYGQRWLNKQNHQISCHPNVNVGRQHVNAVPVPVPVPSHSDNRMGSEKSESEQDAIEGLFMMTKSTPVVHQNSTKQAIEETPLDALAGLLMMNSAPTFTHQKHASIETTKPHSLCGPVHANSNMALPLHTAGGTNNVTQNDAPSASLLEIPTSHEKKPISYEIDNPTSIHAMAVPSNLGTPSGYFGGVPGFLPPYLPFPGQFSVPLSTIPTIKVVQQPPVEVVMENGTAANVRKKSKFTSSEENAWVRRFQQAVDFRRQHGHCRIPYQYPPNSDLARWAKRQKYQYKLFIGERESRDKRSSLTPERIAALESLGFVWDSQEVGWLEQYDHLIAYVRKHGHAKVAKRERSLGRWVCSQRTRLTQGKMTMERFMKLDAVGFIWCSHGAIDNVSRQVEKMRAKAKKEMETHPNLKKRYQEWQAQVPQVAHRKIG